jgi:hypothetical protein
MSKHTPSELLRLFDNTLICCDQDGRSDHFCQVSMRVREGEQAANAKFIFDACRAYDDNQQTIAQLTAALENIRETARSWEGRTDTVPYRAASSSSLS